LYVVTDPRLSKGRSHEEVCAKAIEGGANVIQLRDKDATTKQLCDYGRRLRELARKAGALFIVNDRVDVALAVDADGVHVGQDDLPAQEARRILGRGKIVGVSTSNLEDARIAAEAGADYVAIGAIYETRSVKADAGTPVGPEAVANLRKHTKLPIVAIGGINRSNVSEVVRAGADGIAVISAVVSADDIKAAASELKRIIVEGRARHAEG